MDTQTSTAAPRSVHLSAYVDAALHDLLETFASPEAGALLEAAVAAALGVDAGDVSVSIGDPTAVSATTARVALTWRVGAAGPERSGPATITLLLVQSGRSPLTELLVSIPVGGDVPAGIAGAARRFLDELITRIG